MGSTVARLIAKGLLGSAPRFLANTVQYEVIMGSMAYGVSSDTSDMDVYGFAIPSKEDIFPHLRGEIPGFDEYRSGFDQFVQHHIVDADALGGKGRQYDVTIYSITKYFKLLMANNPNIIDSLFVPRNCVLFITPIGELLREKRKVFLHKGCWHTFKGYAYAQVHKMQMKEPLGKRKAVVEQYGYDLKFAYHVVRLLNEAEQLLSEGELTLDRNKEQLKSIRRGDWPVEKVLEYFNEKERMLETLYLKSALPELPDVNAIRSILYECLERYFGSLDAVVVKSDRNTEILREIKRLVSDIE